MSKAKTIRFGLFLLAGVSLAACGKSGSSDTLARDLSADSGRVEDQFGKGFGEAFRADPNSEPANVREGDMIPVSLTAEPIKID